MNSEDSFNPQEGLQNQAGNESFERSENDSLPAGPPLEPLRSFLPNSNPITHNATVKWDNSGVTTVETSPDQ